MVDFLQALVEAAEPYTAAAPGDNVYDGPLLTLLGWPQIHSDAATAVRVIRLFAPLLDRLDAVEKENERLLLIARMAFIVRCQVERFLEGTDQDRVKLSAVTDDLLDALFAGGYGAGVPGAPPPCRYEFTTEMDDGPLTQRCVLAHHDTSVSHRCAPSYAHLAQTPKEPT